MLTTEQIRANTALEALTDEQVGAIVEMSQNDEASVIGQKTGEIYGGLDADILAASGIAKNGTEKTYDYAKRAIKEIKAAGEAAKQAAVAAALAEKGGEGDEKLRADLATAKAELESVKASYAELKKESEKATRKHERELLDLRVEGEINAAMSGITFKKGLSEPVIAVVKKQAVDKVRALNPEFIDNGKGGTVLTFKGQDGTVMRNPDTNLNPYTAGELLRKELSSMDVLENVRVVTGTGSEETKPNPGTSAVDVAGAKSQTEAYKIIESTLMRQGLTRGSIKFQQAFDEAWKTNNIASLPLN